MSSPASPAGATRTGWSSILDELADGHDVVRVLLVEDSKSDRMLVEEMLRESGEAAVVNSCARLGEALGPVSRGLADLVLLDLSLPDSFGVEGVRRLRAAAPDVPVVVLSGLNDKQVALEAVQAGAQDYLSKDDVNFETLTKAMRYAVERQRSERRLVRLALSDPLTGLPNRILFADRLDQALARAARTSARGRKAARLVVMFIDLDGFKSVNDSLGHLAGDEVLVEVAGRLLEQVRGADTVARLGGDEFTVLCEGVQTADGGVGLAQRLAASLAVPYATEAGEAQLSAAVGIAVAAPQVEDAAALLRRADAAMYAAKREGAGRVAIASGP
jgi:diguanylate cyclase (GGDEF)-like protein